MWKIVKNWRQITEMKLETKKHTYLTLSHHMWWITICIPLISITILREDHSPLTSCCATDLEQAGSLPCFKSLLTTRACLDHLRKWSMIVKSATADHDQWSRSKAPSSVASQHYNLRPRRHTLQLAEHHTRLLDSNFFVRMLYKHCY